MDTLCGIDCKDCMYKEKCKGCKKTCGSPLGGKCVAAEYIKAGGLDAYKEFKEQLKNEINTILAAEGILEADALYELSGELINLEYTFPNGEKVKFLEDKNIYLGTQIESSVPGLCFGVSADTTFILVSSYGENGSDPQIVLYKKR